MSRRAAPSVLTSVAIPRKKERPPMPRIKMPRIAVGGFHHETNSFAPGTAGYDDFVAPDAWPGLSRGNEIIDNFQNLNVGISGFLSAAKEAGWTPVPLASGEVTTCDTHATVGAS